MEDANKLYEEFTKEKVDAELDKCLDFDLFVKWCKIICQE